VSTAEKDLKDEIVAFTERNSGGEPRDVTRLRTLSLPPMGTMPGVLYCNFDLFWAGEQIQEIHEALVEHRIDEATAVSSLILTVSRVAKRLSKWGMEDTVALLRESRQSLASRAPGHPDELVSLLKVLLIALNRVQFSVDGMIPWRALGRVDLLPASTA
jgi:hypothetical protein